MYIAEVLARDNHFQHMFRVDEIKSSPSIIVVERACLSNNGRINFNVRKEIVEKITLSGLGIKYK